MIDHGSCFVRFRAILPVPVNVEEVAESTIVKTRRRKWENDCWDISKFRVEPIRIIRSFDDMDVDITNTVKFIPEETHMKTQSLQSPHPRKRMRYWSNNNTYYDSTTSTRQAALSIDLIVNHIIGYLSWKEQFSSCRFVSKLWNHATSDAPMRVMIFRNQINRQPLPRVLQPCFLDRSLNEMSLKTFYKMPEMFALQKLSCLDIYGDVDLQQVKFFSDHAHDCPLEELYLRYMPIEVLFQIFSSSEKPKFVSLNKLVIQKWGNRCTSTDDDDTEDWEALLNRRIRHHAPNLKQLQVSAKDRMRY